MAYNEMLTPQNCAIALIDYQSAMYQGVQSHDRISIINNVQILAKAAKLFNVPLILTPDDHRPHVHELLAQRRLPQGREGDASGRRPWGRRAD